MLHPLRTPQMDFRLGMLLAMLAGAVNAGGFLAIGQYTSHLTGMVSTAADATVLHQWHLLLPAILGVTCFCGGAFFATLCVNWGARHRPRHQYALPLAFEGLLIILFGLYGLYMPQHWQMPIFGIMLLGMLMGIQNATGGLITNLRTTHHTGTLNDMAVEIGHWAYRHMPRRRTTHIPLPQPNLKRLKVNTGVMLTFILGSVTGAFAFTVLGTGFAIPIGVLLLAITIPILASPTQDAPVAVSDNLPNV